MTAANIFLAFTRELSAPRTDFFNANATKIINAAKNCALKLATGGKIFIATDGWCYPVGVYLYQQLLLPRNRPALPAILLSANSWPLPEAGNNADFAIMRQLETLAAEKKDVLISFFIGDDDFYASLFSPIVHDLELFWLTVSRENVEFNTESQINLPNLASNYALIELGMAFTNILSRFLDYYLFEEPGELTPFLKYED